MVAWWRPDLSDRYCQIMTVNRGVNRFSLDPSWPTKVHSCRGGHMKSVGRVKNSLHSRPRVSSYRIPLTVVAAAAAAVAAAARR